MADLGSILGSAGIGGAIGKAIVSLELDTKKYLAELKGAEAETVASTSKSSAAFGSFGKFASTALLGAGVAAVAFAASSVKAAIEANDAQLKLQNTFANNPMLADSSAAAFTRQADSLRDLTGADDEAIIGAQSLVGQFDLTGQQVQDLIPLIVDLSAKMGVDLDAAAKAVGKSATGTTAGLKRYGIQVDETAAKTDAFGATMDALGKVQGFAADRADAEPWRVLGAQFEELQEKLGQELLPFVQQLSQSLTDAIPILEEFGSILAKLPIASPGILQILGQLGKLKEAGEAALTEGIKPLAEESIKLGQDLYSKVAPQVEEFLAGILHLGEGTGDLTQHFDKAGHAIRNFAGLTNKELKDLRSETEKWVTDSIGSLDSYEKKWHTTSEAAVKAMEGMAKQAKIMARDIKSLDTEGLPDKFILFLREQGPDAIHEFVSGTEKQKTRFISAWRAYEKATGDSVNAMNRLTSAGGTQIGKNLSQGIVQGIESGGGAVTAAARRVVQDAIDAANKQADTGSPSKVMMKLGVDMMVGLANGISDAEQKAIDAARTAMEKVIDQVSSQLDKIKGKAQSFADAIKGGFSGFLDIGGAFGSGLGAEGEPLSLSDIISQQVGGATVLADVLEALKRQGASKGLLAQVAESGSAFGQAILQGGPEQIQEMNAALKTISDLAQETGKGLSEKFFGDKIDKIENKLDKLHDDLRELNGYEREGHSHDIVMDGQKIAEGVRSELIKTGKRNDGTGIN